MSTIAMASVTTPAPRDVWASVLADDPDAVVTQTPQWLECLCRWGGYVDASRLYDFPGGRRIVLPLAGRVWAGVRVAEESWPYGWGYGGAVASGGTITAAEARAVLADLARRPVMRAGVVPMPLSSAPWSAAAPGDATRVTYLTQIVDLEDGFATVWSRRYRTEARRHVRRAARMSLDVYRDNGHGIEAFAALHRASVDRWARQRGHPLWAARAAARRRDVTGRLAAVASTLDESVCTIWSAYRAGEPVAACAVLHRGRHSLGWVAANHRALAGETSAAYLLSSLAIEDACAAGSRFFHMGESDPGSGVQQHKAQFGATSVSYQAVRLERLPVTEGQSRLRAVAGRVSAYRRAGA